MSSCESRAFQPCDPYEFSTALLHPEGFLLIGDTAGTICICDLQTRTIVQQLTGHKKHVHSLVALEGSRFASGSYDKTVRIWDVSGEEHVCTHILEGHPGWICKIEPLPNGMLASGDAQAILKLWDTRTGVCTHTIDGGMGWIQMLTALPDGRLASASMDRCVRVWNVETGEQVCLLLRWDHNVFCCATLADGRLATAGSGNDLSVWDLVTGALVRRIETPAHHIHKIFSLKGDRLAVMGDTFHVWDLKTEREVPGGPWPVMRSGSVQGGIFLAGDRDGVMHVWDLQTWEHGVLPCETAAAADRPLAYTALLPDERILSVTCDGTVCLWDGDWSCRRRAYRRCKALKGELMEVAWNPDRAGAEWHILQELNS